MLKPTSRINFILLISVAMLSLTGCNTTATETSTAAESTIESTLPVETTSSSTEVTPNTSEAHPVTPRVPVITDSPYAEYLNRSPDFMGWLKIEDTQIDEPLLKGVDNNYYLNHNLDGKLSSAGSIYMDYRHIGQFKDDHMAIYGHYMTDGSMFHDLHNYKDADYLDEHRFIEVHGLYESYVYEIFSVHIVSADSYFLYFDIDSEMLLEYAKHFRRLSMHENDLTQPLRLEDPHGLKLLTLVTCTYEFGNARLLIHAYQHHPIN